MRELKFRIRDSGIMHHSVIVGTPPVNPSVYVEGRGWVECTEEAVVMQYTGIEASNKGIYEGDILQITFVDEDSCMGRTHNEIYVVYWNDRDCRFSLKDGNYHVLGDYSGKWDMDILRSPITEDYKVIGNVHEHPELLEGK